MYKNFKRFVTTARVIASSVSIAGGYLLIHRFILNTISNPYASHGITIVILLFIESGSVAFLTTGLSSAYEHRKKQSVLFLLTAALFLSISFFLTVNGSAMWAKKRTDKTSEITETYELKNKRLKADYSKKIAFYQAKYDSIMQLPEHKYYSIRMKRTQELEHLSERILYFQNRINKEEDMNLHRTKTAISDNEKESGTVVFFYYTAAVIIMIMVIIFNFTAVYLKYVYTGDEPEKIAAQEKIAEKLHEKLHEISVQENCTDEISVQEKIADPEITEKPKPLKDEILLLKSKGKKQKEIAEILNISPSTVSRMIKKND